MSERTCRYLHLDITQIMWQARPTTKLLWQSLLPTWCNAGTKPQSVPARKFESHVHVAGHFRLACMLVTFYFMQDVIQQNQAVVYNSYHKAWTAVIIEHSTGLHLECKQESHGCRLINSHVGCNTVQCRHQPIMVVLCQWHACFDRQEATAAVKKQQD